MSSDAKYQPSLHEYMQFLQTLPQLLPTATQYAAALRQAQLLGASPVRVMQTGLAGLRDLWNVRLGNVGPWTNAASDAYHRLTLVVRAYAFAAFGVLPEAYGNGISTNGASAAANAVAKDAAATTSAAANKE